MAHSPSHLASVAAELIEQEGGFVPFVRNVGLGGVAYAFFLQLIAGISSAGEIGRAHV